MTTFSGDTVEVTALAFSPQNNYALAGYKNGKIKLWSLTSKSSLMTFTSEENKPIKFLAFSADGSFLISLNQDHVLIRRPADWGLFTAGKGESGERLYLQAQKESGLQLQGVEIKRLDSRPQAATPH